MYATHANKNKIIAGEGERNERWVKDHYRRCHMHLVPFFGSLGLSQVTAGAVQEYRIERLKKAEGKKKPSRRSLTMKQSRCGWY